MTKGFSKIVNFEKCNTCQFKDTSQDEEPCNECISNPARDGEESNTPINYKPVETKTK